MPGAISSPATFEAASFTDRRPVPHAYRLFGGVLASELAFPELPASAVSRADWTLQIRDDVPELPDPRVLGEEPLIPGVVARLLRGATGYRLSFEDTGTFDVSPDGFALTWYPAEGASLELARLDVIGRVLALAKHAAGAHCLHASAVVIDGRAVAFVAPKGYGKSTTAISLVQRGGRLLTDDTLPVAIDDVAVAQPGVHGLRLREDAAQHLAADETTSAALRADKRVVDFAPERLANEPAPLDAVYLLSPMRGDAPGPRIARRRLAPMEAALVLVAHGKLAPLLRGDEAGRTLMRASRIAREVPVFALQIARDLNRIDDVAATIAGWHSADLQTATRSSAPMPP